MTHGPDLDSHLPVQHWQVGKGSDSVSSGRLKRGKLKEQRQTRVVVESNSSGLNWKRYSLIIIRLIMRQIFAANTAAQRGIIGCSWRRPRHCRISPHCGQRLLESNGNVQKQSKLKLIEIEKDSIIFY